jgi:hypothetical protein
MHAPKHTCNKPQVPVAIGSSKRLFKTIEQRLHGLFAPLAAES